MNNIINLTKGYIETIMTMKKQIIVLIIFGVAIGAFDANFIAYGAGISVMTLVFQVLSVEEISGVDFLVSILPVRKKEYVISRYLGGIISIVIGCVLVTCSYFLLKILGKIEVEIPYINFLATTIISCVIIVAINIPLILKYGAVKGRVFLTFLNIGGVFLPMLLLDILSGNDIFIYIVSNPLTLTVSLLLMGMLLLYISYCITLNLYNKKEVKK